MHANKTTFASLATDVREQDRAFDSSLRQFPGFQFFCERKLTKGSEKKRGRKPCPDGALLDTSTGDVWYLEMKRPSECSSNSWLNTYTGDNFPSLRRSVRDFANRGDCSKQIAEAFAIIAEHDYHMSVRGSRWGDPERLPKPFNPKNVIALPEKQTLRVDAIQQVLDFQGRFIKNSTSNGVTLLFYTMLGETWHDSVITQEMLPGQEK